MAHLFADELKTIIDDARLWRHRAGHEGRISSTSSRQGLSVVLRFFPPTPSNSDAGCASLIDAAGVPHDFIGSTSPDAICRRLLARNTARRSIRSSNRSRNTSCSRRGLFRDRPWRRRGLQRHCPPGLTLLAPYTIVMRTA